MSGSLLLHAGQSAVTCALLQVALSGQYALATFLLSSSTSGLAAGAPV